MGLHQMIWPLVGYGAKLIYCSMFCVCDVHTILAKSLAQIPTAVGGTFNAIGDKKQTAGGPVDPY